MVIDRDANKDLKKIGQLPLFLFIHSLPLAKSKRLL